MKIGIIISDRLLYREFIKSLEADGHGVSLLSISKLMTQQEFFSLATFVKDSEGFDIIHNLGGSYFPLLIKQFVTTPLITTIHEKPSEEDLAIYKKVGVGSFFVAVPETKDIHDVQYISCVDHAKHDMVKVYTEIYEKIIRICAREDHRPWGFYKVLADEETDHKVKRITVWPGKRLSLQAHKRRKEHWIIVSGRALVTLDNEQVKLKDSDSIDIPFNARHRIENIGTEPLVFIEIQKGEYFGEDDIIRFEDDFGRV